VITVMRTGLQATVQDLGRPHFGHLGVPESGAADPESLLRANRLVGNAPGDAGIEFLLGRFAVRFDDAAVFVLAGAPLGAQLDADPVAFGVRQYALAGQVLSTAAPKAGIRTYLAVSGGIDTPVLLGSRSTDTLSGLGHPPLTDGTVLPVGEGRSIAPDVDYTVPPTVTASGFLDVSIRMGPRDDLFTPEAVSELTSAIWTVTPDVDRIGVRLRGPKLIPSNGSGLATEGLAQGSIQVPSSGAPIVLLANHPPTGGYPVIAVVDRGDVPRIAQARPGTTIRFRALRRLEYSLDAPA